MAVKIPLHLDYSAYARPALMLDAPVEHEARYVKTAAGPGIFAIIRMRFEPVQSADPDQPVVLVNDAQVDASDREVTPIEDFDSYVQAVARGCREMLNALYSENRPIVNLRITLTSLRIHEVDSNEVSFRGAGRVSIQKLIDEASFTHYA